jgi:hypothetical protein
MERTPHDSHRFKPLSPSEGMEMCVVLNIKQAVT